MTYARENYIVDYSSIADATRGINTPNQFNDMGNLRHACLSSYKLRRWDDQDYYIEVWAEKDAMTSTLIDITRKYCVPYMSNHGYSSTTAMHDANLRFKYKSNHKECIIIYLGDHDPSGLDMDNDIAKRVFDDKDSSNIVRLALTKEQIDAYDLPANPAKIDDPRSKVYIDEYGEDSWELEALPIKTVRQLLIDSIESYIDFGKYNSILDYEKKDKAKIMQWNFR